MIWAMKNKEKILAESKIKGAVCCFCGEEVISKCGSIKVWHWAHKSKTDCDSWGEEETDWHKNWKNEFPKECQEVIIEEKFNNKHRADINIKNIVLELQNSPISAENIIEREKFYNKQIGNIIWLLNGKELCSGFDLRTKGDIITFRWKHPAKSWWAAKNKIYIDFGDWLNVKTIFLVKKIYQEVPCGGWGLLLSKEEFLNEIKNGNTK